MLDSGVLHPGLTLAERVKCAALILAGAFADQGTEFRERDCLPSTDDFENIRPDYAKRALLMVDALEAEALKREKVPYVPPKHEIQHFTLPAPFSGIDP